MATAPATSYLPYHEPGIVTILVQASFLFFLNIINYTLDQIIYCGLVGQVLLGVAWGTPGANWLGDEIEHAVVQLGYLGLLLLIYEGGLSTSFSSLKANAVLSVAVAITGIAVPIGLSFTLQPLANATSLQSFAAGAALCSTSLGTTFTILGTSGLAKTRLGVVLTSAAMLDDVVGLIMVQVISNIGSSASTFDPVTVVRPLFVSIGLVVVVIIGCRLIVQPMTNILKSQCDQPANKRLRCLFQHPATALVIHTLVLSGLVAGATYAGSSNLFAAYLAGASVSWWDNSFMEQPGKSHGDMDHQNTSENRESAQGNLVSGAASTNTQNTAISQQLEGNTKHTGNMIYERYYAAAFNRILKPFFFASIGFAIPITRMFSGNIVWRGLVYAIFMTVAKLTCGFWLIRFELPGFSMNLRKFRMPNISWCTRRSRNRKTTVKSPDPTIPSEDVPTSNSTGREQDPNFPRASEHDSEPKEKSPAQFEQGSPQIKKPRSLYPSSILGLAMVARGEIGFLISSLAESNGIFSNGDSAPGESSDIYLIVTWAIVICTIISPIWVGLLVKRVKGLQRERAKSRGGEDPLGVWGVS